MWYLDRFSLTPFDSRYLALPFEWMEFSYMRYMSKRSDAQIRDINVFNILEEKKDTQYNKELESQRPQLEKCYSDSEVEDIMKAFKDAR